MRSIHPPARAATPAAFALLFAVPVVPAQQERRETAETQVAETSLAKPGVSAPRLEQLLGGAAPKGVAELRAIEAHTKALWARVRESVVSVSGASGVLVEGGWVLSAAHVTRGPKRRVRIALADGRTIDGTTLGVDNRSDASLVKVDDPALAAPGALPALPLAPRGSIEPGEWCVALGYPGGRGRWRAPPLRLGRVLRNDWRGFLVSDCTISAGDSGGPLIDMQGRVIGIHSRITNELDTNMHVPIDSFHREWERLAAGEVLGQSQPGSGFLGVERDPDVPAARVLKVFPGSAAAKAGIQPGDVITHFAGWETPEFEVLQRLIQARRPGDRANVLVDRGGERLTLRITLGERQE